MSLEGETLSPDEIAQLLEASGGLVPLKGKWVEVDREKLKEALEHWKDVEKDVRREGISFFEGMRLLSGANLATEEEDESQAAIREWSGLTAGPELDSILKGLRSPETRQEMAPPDLKAVLRAVSADGLCLAAVRRPPGTGSLPGRRYGPRQDDPGDLAAARSEARQAEEREPARRAGLADRELEIGAGEVRAESFLRRGPSFGSERDRR